MWESDYDREQPYDDEAEWAAEHETDITICYDCGKPSPLGWSVPENWSSVAVENVQQFICPECWSTMNGYRLRWLAEQKK